MLKMISVRNSSLTWTAMCSLKCFSECAWALRLAVAYILWICKTNLPASRVIFVKERQEESPIHVCAQDHRLTGTWKLFVSEAQL